MDRKMWRLGQKNRTTLDILQNGSPVYALACVGPIHATDIPVDIQNERRKKICGRAEKPLLTCTLCAEFGVKKGHEVHDVTDRETLCT